MQSTPDPNLFRQQIEELKTMKPRRVRFFKYNKITDLLNVDMEMMRTQSSITLMNTALHEIGHGLGLNHYSFYERGQPKPLMGVSIYDELDDLTLPKEVDHYAKWGVQCLYNDLL